MKETRDFLLGEKSYQEKTQAELGKRFEPATSIDNAEQFFAKQPGIRHLAPEDINGSYVLSIAIGGAQLAEGAQADITIHVGFDKQTEPFKFLVAVPPSRSRPTGGAK